MSQYENMPYSDHQRPPGGSCGLGEFIDTMIRNPQVYSVEVLRTPEARKRVRVWYKTNAD